MPTSTLTIAATLGSSAFAVPDETQSVCVTPDGTRILSVGFDASVHVWDATTGAAAGELAGKERGLYCVATNGKTVVSGGHDVSVFDLATRKLLATLGRRQSLVTAAAMAPDGSFVFGDGRTPRRFDAKGKKELPALPAHKGAINAVAISADGTRAVTASDKAIAIVALDDKKPKVVWQWEAHAKACGMSPDGTLVWAAGYFEASVRDVATQKVVLELAPTQGRTGALSPDGKMFAVGTDKAIVFYELPKKKPVAKIAIENARFAFTADGKRVVTATDTGISVYDIATARRVLPDAVGTSGSINGLATCAAIPHAVFSIGEDGKVCLWDAEAGGLVETIGALKGAGRGIAATPDGTLLVTAGADDPLAAWDVKGLARVKLPDKSHMGQAVAVSADGSLAGYQAYAPRALHVFDLARKKRVMEVAEKRAASDGVVAFWRNELVLSLTNQGELVATRIPKGERAWTLGRRVTDVCAMGDAVLAGTLDGTFEVLDPATGESRATLREGERYQVQLCALDGDRVAVLAPKQGGTQSVVEVWSVSAAAMLGRAEIDRAEAIAASPDGRRVYAGTKTGKILVIEAPAARRREGGSSERASRVIFPTPTPAAHADRLRFARRSPGEMRRGPALR